MKGSAPATATTCYRHPHRETAVGCSSCGRPICPDCMTSTSVGMRCPECSRQKTKVRTIRDVQQPVVTSVIIALCTVAFVAELLTRHLAGDSVLARGALAAGPIADGQVWRIVTSGFLHDDRFPAGLLHIGFNMYFLYILGQMLEPTLGRTRFALVFAVSLIGGSLGALLLSPDRFTVGASGAVFGLLGAGLMELRSRGIAPMQTPLGSVLLLNLVITFGFAGFISVGGHLGGLFAGGVAGYLLFEIEGTRRSLRSPIVGACVAMAVALAVACVAIS
ncbi:MAG: rhomboid family intramembrane serine protease [Actinomycetota bacterium]|nr:rhomboid family intramembrane serine protease [Actinomycetota bacterium]